MSEKQYEKFYHRAYLKGQRDILTRMKEEVDEHKDAYVITFGEEGEFAIEKFIEAWEKWEKQNEIYSCNRPNR